MVAGDVVSRVFGQYFSIEMAALCLVEWALTAVILYGLLVSAPGIAMPMAYTGAGNLSALMALTIGVSAVTIGLYRPEICVQRGQLLAYAVFAGMLAVPGLLLVSGTLRVDLNREYLLWLGQSLIAWGICLFCTRWLFGYAMHHRVFVRRILVLGAGPEAARTRAHIQSHRRKFFELVQMETAPPGGIAANTACNGRDLLHITRELGIWGIVDATGQTVNHPGDGITSTALLDLKLRGVRVFNELAFWEHQLGRINLDLADARWLTFGDGFASSWVGDRLKRTTDILGCLVMLALTMPLMLISALLIKMDSPGPVFYRQERVGLYGKPFVLFKFRSMSANAELGGTPRWAAKRDTRITRVGGFIRSTRIDELPQLLNVLRGEMSFVGPRPERPHFVGQLGQILPFYAERSYVKPGITGWAQVNFPYGASIEDSKEKLSFDLYYVKNRSLVLDMLILFSTVRVILFREGAR
jgi:sugar transferase (PEP-CTERM system associated)